jgi:cytochrome o ubiquinol oxidase operon protein cyoD
LTLIAFYLVGNHSFSSTGLKLVVLLLAVIQLFVQTVFFLHLGKESKPRWNLIVFGFAVMVVFIVVVGSLWIMNNLGYHMASPEQTDQQIIKDEGIQE